MQDPVLKAVPLLFDIDHDHHDIYCCNDHNDVNGGDEVMIAL